MLAVEALQRGASRYVSKPKLAYKLGSTKMKGVRRLAVQVTLTIVGGKHAGKIVPVTRRKFYIGRASDCHLRSSSDVMSRHHCMILVGEDVTAVRDLGSKNGTRVNGEEVRGQRVLKSGDRLAVGNFEFEIQVPAAQGDDNKPEPERMHTPPTPTAAPAGGADLDFDERAGGTNASTVAVPDRKRTGLSAVRKRLSAARQDDGETAEVSQDTPTQEISEEEKEARRRQRPIVGVSKAVQARRGSATSRDAAAEALAKFYGRE